MVNIYVCCVGKLRESWLREASAEYEKRLGAYCRLHITESEDEKSQLASLPQKAYKIALCVEGKELSSPELAALMADVPLRGKSEIAFLIGPAEGMSEAAKAVCDFRLSFSRMTFPHQLMRVILLEQIYRACNINAGGSYHK